MTKSTRLINLIEENDDEQENEEPEEDQRSTKELRETAVDHLTSAIRKFTGQNKVNALEGDLRSSIKNFLEAITSFHTGKESTLVNNNREITSDLERDENLGEWLDNLTQDKKSRIVEKVLKEVKSNV